jgi:hypothetical protein
MIVAPVIAHSCAEVLTSRAGCQLAWRPVQALIAGLAHVGAPVARS